MSSEALTYLSVDHTKIEELGPSIGRCSKLTVLDFVKCRNLAELPDSITQLSSLEELLFTKCYVLTKLPDNMRLLSKLQYLCVAKCPVLHSLPELPPSLRTLDATNCTSLETVFPSTISSTPQNKGRKFFSFKNCVKLDLGTIEEQAKLLEKAVLEKEDVKVYYPGKKVPEWFGNNRKQNDSDTLKLCLSSHNLVGFVFGAVASDLLNGSTGHLDVVFSVEEDEMTKEVVRFEDFTYGNVLLCSNPKVSDWILEKIEGKRRNHDATTYNPNLSFELRFYRNGSSGHPDSVSSDEEDEMTDSDSSDEEDEMTEEVVGDEEDEMTEEVVDFDDRCPTVEFGVYPIYASGNSELNSNSRKRKAVMI